MVNLVAKKDMRYASRDLRAGECFEATDKDAEILKGVGHAEDAADDGAADDAANAQSQQPRKPRTYRRRDLLAEGSGDGE